MSRFRRLGAGGGLLALVMALGALTAPLPEAVELPPAGMDILDRNGALLYQVIDPQRGAARPVALEVVAPALRLATIAVEDASFDRNPGIDLLATLRALIQDISAGHVVAGGSTITQQLARLRYLTAEQRASKSVERKLAESWLALRLTQALGKTTVLEQYLNSAPYGNLAVGAEAAAWTYFGRPARELSLAQLARRCGRAANQRGESAEGEAGSEPRDSVAHRRRARRRRGAGARVWARRGVARARAKRRGEDWNHL